MKFNENPTYGGRVAARRRTDTTKPIVAPGNFSKTPKNCLCIHFMQCGYDSRGNETSVRWVQIFLDAETTGNKYYLA
jgi:hypothetical protein